MEIEEIVNEESYEQVMLATAVEEFLTKLLEEYPEEYYVEITVGNDDESKMITPLTKTFRGSKKFIE